MKQPSVQPVRKARTSRMIKAREDKERLECNLANYMDYKELRRQERLAKRISILD